ncbi:MAG TPA: c-type cytochrome [Steroidobacteraceae bacterium]|nr:c-type cytochrome [Steroidobacteraceae bacterium]
MKIAKWALPLAAIVVLGLVMIAVIHWRSQRLQARLLATPPEAVANDPALVRFATAQARPLFAAHCALCHGADMRGNPALGAPNLTDSVWLYGDGRLFDIELTIMYGIRSGLDKTHNETDMPSFGLRGVLSDAQIRNVVQYVLQLSGRPYGAEAANEGRAVYVGTGNCGDCHGPDARGNSDYGAPDLTRNVWNSGGDPQSLYTTIYFGQHRMMPAWKGSLTLEQIRALATYVYAVSHAK